MAYKSLSQFISALESAGELIRINEFVSPHLEITEITDRIVKNNGKALLFENNGTGFPLLINAFGSEKRMCMALGVNKLDDIGIEVEKVIHDILGPKETFLDKLRVIPTLASVASWLPKGISGRGSCQEIVMQSPDLTRLPVLTCWPADGGPFITLPVVHTQDPESGARNAGMYRMQVFSADLTAMHWHLHKGSALHYLKYKERNQRMPVTVTLGGDPVYTYAATAPLPENMDEYVFAGFLRKKKVEMVRCLTNDLEVPADVDFVIEGYIDPEEDLILEGPFGDHTGFYSLADYYPRFHVTCITHRKNAVYPATVVGIPPMEDGWIGKATERIFLMPIRMSAVPEIRDMAMPVEGVFHNLVLTRIEKRYPGQGLKVMNSLWGAGQMMFNKIMIVTDRETDLENYPEIARIVTETVNPLTDIHFIKGPVDILDHSSRNLAFGSKMGIDATEKWPDEKEPGEVDLMKPLIDSKRIRETFQEISAILDDLLDEQISLVIISLKKARRNHIQEISKSLVSRGLIRNIKFIIFMDSEVNIKNLRDVTWICANNIDPQRDSLRIQKEDHSFYPGLFIDGTRKTFEYDHFQRDWPNIIVMDDEIIQQIDNRWHSFSLGDFLHSPSLLYKSLVMNYGAVVQKMK
jgi:4-hydroxy-3-polyprenylbenzoate decarboxylase